MGKVVHVPAHTEVVKGKTISHRAYSYTHKGGMGQRKAKRKPKARRKPRAKKG